MKLSRLLRLITNAAPLLLLFPSVTQAEDMQFQGVITQGLSLTDHNNFLGESEDGPSYELTEFALNGSTRLTDNINVYGQLLYRHAGAVEETDIDHLVLDMNTYMQDNWSTGFQLGRFKLPYGLYNEARDIAFSRTTVSLAQSLYPDSQRDLKRSADGLVLYSNYFALYGQWRFTLAHGSLNLDNISGLPGFLPVKGQFRNEKATIFRALYESYDNRLKLATTLLEGRVNYRFDIADTAMLPSSLMLAGDIKERQFIASMEYHYDNWVFSGEYKSQKTKSDYPKVQIGPGAFMDINLLLPGEFYYFQALYQLNKTLSLYTRRDIAYNNRYEKDNFTAMGTPAHSGYAKDNTFGLMWSFHPSFLLGVEYHHVHGTQWLSTLDNKNNETEENWQLFLLSLSYRF